MRAALVLLAACSARAVAPTPSPAPYVQVRVPVSQLAYRLIVEGEHSTLEATVPIRNASPHAWSSAILDVELELPPLIRDRDHDGIADDQDGCPDTPAAHTGMVGFNGCPTRGRVVTKDTAIEILDLVSFMPRSTVIDASARPVLDAITATLDSHPEIQLVEVQGHASADEPRAGDLARKRAELVRDELVARGVEPKRLAAKSYGTTAPSPKPERSRRVSFAILVRTPEEDEPLWSIMPPVPPLPREAVQRVWPRTLEGPIYFTALAPVTLARGEDASVVLVHATLDAREVLIVDQRQSRTFRGVRLHNRTNHALPRAEVSVVIGGTFAGKATLGPLAAGEDTVFAVGDGTLISVGMTRDDKSVPRHIVAIHHGWAFVESDSIAMLRFGAVNRDDVYTQRVKDMTTKSVGLPPGTIDVGDALWIPVPRRALVIEEHQTTRYALQLLSSPATSIEPYITGSMLPTDVADRLRAVLDAMRALRGVPRATPAYYRGRAALRALLIGLNYNAP